MKNAYLYIAYHQCTYKKVLPKHIVLKVGITTNRKARMRDAQTWAPFGIGFVFFLCSNINTARNREHAIHDKYRKYSTKNGGTEWLSIPLHIYPQLRKDCRENQRLIVPYIIRPNWWNELMLKLTYFNFKIKNVIS